MVSSKLERLTWTAAAWEDYVWWQGQDRKTLKRINLLIAADGARGLELIRKRPAVPS